MSSTNRTQAIRVVFATLAAAAALWGQSGAGTIQGTVQDATSSAVPTCAVQARNQATGITLETTSNASGFYALKGLTAGTYTVSFAAPGMKKSESVITLQNGQVLVFNPQLAVGEVSEKITVAG